MLCRQWALYIESLLTHAISDKTLMASLNSVSINKRVRKEIISAIDAASNMYIQTNYLSAHLHSTITFTMKNKQTFCLQDMTSQVTTHDRK